MTATLDPRNGLLVEFTRGGSNWANDMENTLKKITRIGFHLMVTSRSLNSPPANVSEGDTYIVAPGGSDEWNNLDNQVVVYTIGENSNDWQAYPPRKGWLAFIDDEEVLSCFKDDSNGWSPGVSI